MKKSILLAACLALSGGAFAQLRVATWNFSNYSGGRDADLKTSIYGVFQGRSLAPDAFFIQEIISASALTTFVGILNSAPGSPGDWSSAPFLNGPDTDSAFCYRTSKIQYLGTTIVAPGSSTNLMDQPRATYRYDFRPVGYSAANTTIAAYNVHLKAGTSAASGSTASDIDRRLIETQRIRKNANGVANGSVAGIPAGWNALVCGDFNIQRASEVGYQELVGSQPINTGRFYDPINLGATWYDSSTYRFVHTQDPSGTGGMDDRFDQILLTDGLFDGTGLEYIGNKSLSWNTNTWNDPNHSYRCWGNDGNSFNTQINRVGNTNVGDTIATALYNAVTTAGGHLPVFLDLKVPGKLAVTAPTIINFGTVALGGVSVKPVTVLNGANTALWTAAGISSLSYTLTATPGFTVPGGPFTAAGGASGNVHNITLNTSTSGFKYGQLTITSNDPDNPTKTVILKAFVGRVINPLYPPFGTGIAN